MSNESTEEQLPAYVIEGARSSRSKCKTCGRAIDKGKLRIGILVEGRYGPGYLWHHLPCAARRQLERVEEAYDLQAWKEAKEPPSDVPAIEELRKLREEAEERRQKRKDPPYAELAPSGRSKCKHCDELIEKGAYRVVLGRLVTFGRQERTTPINVHPRCVPAELRREDCTVDPDDFEAGVRATSELSEAQIEEVLQQIG